MRRINLVLTVAFLGVVGCATSRERSLVPSSVRVCIPAGSSIAATLYVQPSDEPTACFIIRSDGHVATAATLYDTPCDEMGLLDMDGTVAPATLRAEATATVEGTMLVSAPSRYEYDLRIRVSQNGEVEDLRAAGAVDPLGAEDSGCYARRRVSP